MIIIRKHTNLYKELFPSTHVQNEKMHPNKMLAPPFMNTDPCHESQLGSFQVVNLQKRLNVLE